LKLEEIMSLEYPDGFCGFCGKWAAPPKVVTADSADPHLATVKNVFCDNDCADLFFQRMAAKWPIPAGR
jgi:hypothetical protein